MSFVFRRGATYVWRRRLPVTAGKGGCLQLSLGTRDPVEARVVGSVVTARSHEVFWAMFYNGLTEEQARAWLKHVIREETDRIRGIRNACSAGAGNWKDDRDTDWATGQALRLLAERGQGATLTDQDFAAFRSAGVTESALDRLRLHLPFNVQFEYGDDRMRKLRRSVGETLKIPQPTVAQLLEAQTIRLRGRSASYLASLEENPSQQDAAMAMARQMLDIPTVHFDSELEAKNDDGAAPGEDYNPAVSAVVERLVAQAVRRKIKLKSLNQLRQIATLFSEATGVTDVTKIRQADIARFRDVMGTIPKTYRKSPRDRALTLSQIIERSAALAPAQVGLSATTVNRNISFIKQIVAAAAAKGLAMKPGLNFTALREKQLERARDKRHPFTVEEVLQLFRHPAFHGTRSASRRFQPGDMLIKDGRYWVPLIAAYTGARLSEIAGLDCKDIRELENIWYFDFRENDTRTIKNLTSLRAVPIHSHLVELGLLGHAPRSGPLFPELKKKSSQGEVGEALDYSWRKIQTAQLGAVEKKSFHSFRHYVKQRLALEPTVTKDTRLDILGHAGGSVDEEVYGAAVPLPVKQAAIELLPRVF